MKKIAILGLSLLAFTGINFSAQANEDRLSTSFYNLEKDFSLNDMYQHNIEFEKEGLCNTEGAFFKIIQKYNNKNKIGEVYKCVDSKWTYQNDISDKVYKIESSLIKNKTENISFGIGVSEGDIGFVTSQKINRYIHSYDYIIKNNTRKEEIKLEELKTGITQFFHIYKDENNDLNLLAKIYFSYLNDNNNLNEFNNLEPVKNINYERTFKLKNFKDNKIENTILLYDDVFDIQIKINE